MKIHHTKNGEVVELRVLIDRDQYILLQRFRDRFNKDQRSELTSEDVAAVALVGTLARMQLFKDPP